MTQGNDMDTSPHTYRGAVEAIVAVQSLIGIAFHIHSWADVATILNPENPIISYGTGHLIWSVVSGLGLCIYRLKLHFRPVTAVTPVALQITTAGATAT